MTTTTSKKLNRCTCSGTSDCVCHSCRQIGSTGFSRPNFFAGQLLTDEDLRDTLQYVVEKNRLHNRHFFGEGVVCGLQVVPHPCIEERHKVIVHKGHAINGCGDDILVTRKHEVDILQRVRDLIAETMGGYDCGDPCSTADAIRSSIGMLRKEWAAANTSSERERIERRMQELQGEIDSLRLATTPVKYGLYVRYVEQQSELVTPYQVDECSSTVCQASRIRESYSFELRCPEPRQFDDLRARLDACSSVVHNYETLQGSTLHGISTLEMVQKILTQFDTIEETLTEPELPGAPLKDLSNDQIAELKTQTYWPGALDLDVDELKTKTLTEVRIALANTLVDWIRDRFGEDAVSDDPQLPFKALTSGQLTDLRGIVFLPQSLKALNDGELNALTRDQLAAILPADFNFETACLSEISVRLGEALQADLLRDLNSDAIDEVTAAFSEGNIPSGTSAEQPVPISAQRAAVRAAHAFLTLGFRARVFVADLSSIKTQLVSAQELLAGKLPLLQHVEPATTDKELPVPKPILDLLTLRNTEFRTALDSGGDIERTFNVRSRTVGEMLETNYVERVFATLDRVNEILRGFMAAGEISFTPELRLAMLGVSLGVFNGNSHLIDQNQFARIMDQARVVSRAVAEVARLCMCEALLPPCPADNDTAVLLAEVTVANCEVTDICNLSRRMVVTGPSLRYWFSDFRAILAGLRDSCCPTEGSIAQVGQHELDRIGLLRKKWTNDASVSDASEPPFIPVLVGTSEKKGRLAQIKDWGKLHATAVEVLGQVAVAPAEPAVQLFSPLNGGPLTQQSMNIALARLSGRPTTDIRNLLLWSDEFGSPAEVRQIAEAAKTTADSIKGTADAANDTAENADLVARSAQTAAATADGKADAAQAAATTADGKADAAQAAATTADGKADAAQAAATTADGKADAAQAAATTADGKADAAQAAATTADGKADAAQAAATTADGKADAAQAAATTADGKADAAQAAATTADGKADAAQAAATTADGKADAAQAAATTADGKADAAQAAAATADGKADAAQAAATEAKADARFDFDNDGSPEKTIQEVVDELRAKAAAGELGTIAQIKKAVDDIAGKNP